MKTNRTDYLKKPVTFSYHKDMEPSFKAGINKFTRDTHIMLKGITYKIEGDNLIVTITQEQHEQWLFHLALCIGQNIKRVKTNARSGGEFALVVSSHLQI